MTLRQRPLFSQRGIEQNKRTYQVVIRPHAESQEGLGSVIGNLKNEFSMALNAEWAPLFDSIVPGADTLRKLGDASLMSGIFSRKYFKGGNHLTLPIEMRILDEGIGSTSPVVDAVRNLTNLVVARPFNFEQSKALIERKAKGAVQGGKQAASGILNPDESAPGALLKGANTLFKGLTDSNRLVSINIGTFFKCPGMIITGVTYTYSREQTDRGPLFADFSVQAESMQAIVRGSGDYGVDSVITGGKHYRVTIDGNDTDRSTAERNPNIGLRQVG